MNISARPSRISAQLDLAARAVAALEEQGLKPRSVSVSGAKPIIVIDRPSPQLGLNGMQHIRESKGGMVARSLIAAPFKGCQVQWDVCTATAPAHH